MAAWHQWLATGFVETTALTVNVTGKRYVGNRCGARVAVEHLIDPEDAVSRTAAAAGMPEHLVEKPFVGTP